MGGLGAATAAYAATSCIDCNRRARSDRRGRSDSPGSATIGLPFHGTFAMPEPSATLPGQPSLSPGAVNLILFSRADCAFCRIVREHYLLPLAAKRPPRLFLADIDIESRAMMTGWQRQRLTQAAFAA